MCAAFFLIPAVRLGRPQFPHLPTQQHLVPWLVLIGLRSLPVGQVLRVEIRPLASPQLPLPHGPSDGLPPFLFSPHLP